MTSANQIFDWIDIMNPHFYRLARGNFLQIIMNQIHGNKAKMHNSPPGLKEFTFRYKNI